ncbi:hypothetical protein PM082_005709 [Marasmius tenuissimus]|nr:hypothetical protein PM082_005709 [Marasmius tenuissimus]
MVLHFFVPVLLLSLTLFTYERTLVPIYASVPTNQYFQHFLFLAVALSIYIRPKFSSTARKWFFSGTILALAPKTTYYLAVWSARQRHPVWGPVFTHAFALIPLVYAYGIWVPATKMLGVWGTLVGGFAMSKRLWPAIPQLRTVSDNEIYLTQALAFFAIGVLCLDFSSASPSSAKTPKKSPSNSNKAYLTKGTLLGALVTLAFTPLTSPLRSPILEHPYPETYTHPSFPLQIHSTVESTTGLVVVGEALKPPNADPTDLKAMHSVRYLRAAHSILGGVWMGKRVHTIDGYAPVKDVHGNRLGDSIYGAFNLQEAARLIEHDGASGKKKGNNQKALVIGLGTGISATALHRHGYNLTVLEIDPAVYEAARRFFGFPDPGDENVFLEDAGAWVATRAKQREDAGKEDVPLYDLVNHDCFSGGGIPQHLYEIGFWDNLKALIKPDGVVVINFAGIVDSEPSRLVLRTLDEAFSQCKAFHDLVQPGALTKEKYDTEFLNVVFFCTTGTKPFTFRTPDMTDYLGSPLRKHIFTSLEDREVDLEVLRNTTDRIKTQEGRETKVLSSSYNPLGKMQDAQATKHWTMMREVLPDIFWETF